MKRALLALVALPVFVSPALVSAAAPHRPLTLSMPSDDLSPLNPSTASRGAAKPNQAYEPAPLPNRSLAGPAAPDANPEPHVAPTLFTSREQYRGDGFSRGSSVQGEQQRNVKPPVGFSLHMPFTPQ